MLGYDQYYYYLIQDSCNYTHYYILVSLIYICLLFINQGGLLNYNDVLIAINSGKLLGVGIDVYHTEPFPIAANDEFLSHHKVIVTPHVAGVTHISYTNMAKIVAANILRIKNGEVPIGAINNV